MPPIIVKLGGSAITWKTQPCTPKLELIQKSVRAIAKARVPVVLLHGGGSFAHPFVQKVALHRGYRGSFQLNALSETELYLDQLSRIIAVALLSRGVPFIPIRPGNIATLRNNRIVRCFLEPVRSAIDLGVVPLMHGDLAFNEARDGIGVLSADHLASFLGVKLKASRILFGCDVRGVYSQDPKLSNRATLIEKVTRANYMSVLDLVEKHPGSDATGGMLNKVTEAIWAARRGVESIIFDLSEKDSLDLALMNRPIAGSRFVPWR